MRIRRAEGPIRLYALDRAHPETTRTTYVHALPTYTHYLRTRTTYVHALPTYTHYLRTRTTYVHALPVRANALPEYEGWSESRFLGFNDHFSFQNHHAVKGGGLLFSSIQWLQMNQYRRLCPASWKSLPSIKAFVSNLTMICLRN